jgi:lysine-N-methylase
MLYQIPSRKNSTAPPKPGKNQTINKMAKQKKNTPNEQFDYYPDQHFDCTRCGFCCNNFEIAVSPDEMAALKKFKLPNGAPPPNDWFSPAKTRDGFFAIAKDKRGWCSFMDDDGNCLLHNTIGWRNKPLICQVFPMHIAHWKDGKCSAELRFVCEGVAREDGTLLTDQADVMNHVAEPLRTRLPESNVEYSNANPAPLTTVRQVHGGCKKILHDNSIPLQNRLYSVARIIDFHSQKQNRDAIAAADEHFAGDAVEFANKASDVLKQELTAGTASLSDRLDFRILTMGYLRDDDEAIAKSTLRRFKILCAHSMFGAGGGNLQDINPEAPRVNGRNFLKYAKRLACDEPALELFGQFFFGKLDAMHFCGNTVHDYTYEEGIKHLLLSAPVGFALAASFAVNNKNNIIDRESMLVAVRLLDLTFSRSPFFRLNLAKRLINKLSQPANYAGILNLVIEEK